MTQPDVNETTLPARRRKPPRGPLIGLLLLLLLAAAGGGYFLVSRPRLHFSNRLAAPVRLVVDTREARTVPAGESTELTLRRGRTVVGVWELVRPLSADGRPMGEEVRGSMVEQNPAGSLRRAATARGADADYFAPLITNASDDLLRVTINAGLEGAVDCGCAVRPGAKRVFIGYYRLYQNSTVEGKTGNGRVATFRNLGPNALTPDGTVGLRFESKDLRGR